MKRKMISKKANRSIFKRTARKVHKRNIYSHTNRGGIRL